MKPAGREWVITDHGRVYPAKEVPAGERPKWVAAEHDKHWTPAEQKPAGETKGRKRSSGR